VDILETGIPKDLSIKEIRVELPEDFKLEKVDCFLELTHRGEQVTCFTEPPTIKKLQRIINLCS
jgi:hypothetical protein